MTKSRKTSTTDILARPLADFAPAIPLPWAIFPERAAQHVDTDERIGR